MEKGVEATILGILVNIALFMAKFAVGFLSGSLAIMSDAFNSLTDIISSVAVFLAVRTSGKKADSDHPFGHRRAEPIAGLIMAVFAGILGFEVLKASVIGVFSSQSASPWIGGIAVLVFSIAVKLSMFFYFRQHGKDMDSPALNAAAIDSRNDVFVSAIALLGVLGSGLGLLMLDSIAAFLISLFIFYSCYRIGVENIDYLMGKAPAKEKIDEIKKAVLMIKGVTGINDVRAHYVGNKIHIEIHIEVKKKTTTFVSHGIGKDVQRAVEKFSYVDKAFIHIDPR